VPPCTGSANPREVSPKPNREDTNNTIIVKVVTSDRSSENSDDSNDKDYVDECPRLAK